MFFDCQHGRMVPLDNVACVQHCRIGGEVHAVVHLRHPLTDERTREPTYRLRVTGSAALVIINAANRYVMMGGELHFEDAAAQCAAA